MESLCLLNARGTQHLEQRLTVLVRPYRVCTITLDFVFVSQSALSGCFVRGVYRGRNSSIAYIQIQFDGTEMRFRVVFLLYCN